MPTDAWAIGAYLSLLVPGIVFIAVRARLRGFVKVDTQVGSRVLLAFVVSAIFAAVYAAIYGPYVLVRTSMAGTPTPVEVLGWSFAYLGLAIAVPALTAWLIYRSDGTAERVWNWLKDRNGGARFESIPTAWDLGATRTTAGWVRVRLAPGDWIGGRFEDQSYFSTYPEPRDLFIQEQWKLTDDGAFDEPVEGAAGMWVSIRDDYIVEWVHSQPTEEEE
ncbi:DUF6338 family protein [Curtobacterium sp. MCPF17_052]|uniref:DUF6338 family protein n=1 Tax=Curtobacterium sp. MCPF17_052 TaxID=2175655 RepID=UPI0024DF3D02|nr:DUF6338 family protein [Curtobacterium sp. MCPF17_052]WIB13304.1 DUF6338 family protein [Curtobacterium sp. MCPF17_052]